MKLKWTVHKADPPDAAGEYDKRYYLKCRITHYDPKYTHYGWWQISRLFMMNGQRRWTLQYNDRMLCPMLRTKKEAMAVANKVATLLKHQNVETTDA